MDLGTAGGACGADVDGGVGVKRRRRRMKLTLEQEIAEKIVAAVEQLHGKTLRLHLVVGRGGLVRQPMDVLAEWVKDSLIPTCRGC